MLKFAYSSYNSLFGVSRLLQHGVSCFKCTANLSALHCSEGYVTAACAGAEGLHCWCFIFMVLSFTVSLSISFMYCSFYSYSSSMWFVHLVIK